MTEVNMTRNLAALTFLALLCCAAGPAQDDHHKHRVLIVSASGEESRTNERAEDGSDEKPFHTIQAAVDVASPGDTIRVRKGVYRNPGFGAGENNGPVALIGKGGNADEGSLTLMGDPGAVIEFDGNGGILGGQGVAYVRVQNFVVKGPAAGISESLAMSHRLDNPGLSKYNGQGISFPGPSNHIEILNNVVSDACGSGIRVNQGDYILIQGNSVSNSTGCSALAESALVIAQATNVDDSDEVKITIKGNRVFGNRNYLPFYAPNGFPPGAKPPFPSYGKADSTYIIDGSGVYLTRNKQFYAHGKYLVANNLAYGNGINGLVVHYTDRVIVSNNTIANNGTVPLDEGRQKNSGLVINHSDDIEMLNNRVQVDVPGDWAIRFFGQVTVVKSSGNEVAGGKSDLTTGVEYVSNVGSITEVPKD
jgi:Right handed beta helix region